MIVQSNRPWKWRYGGAICCFRFLLRAIFRENFKGNIRKNCKCYYKKPIDNNFPWSSVIEVRNDVKMLKKKKMRSKTARLRLLVPLEFWTAFDVISIRFAKFKLQSKNDKSWEKFSELQQNQQHHTLNVLSSPFQKCMEGHMLLFPLSQTSDHCLQKYKRASATNLKGLALLWSKKRQQSTAY